jgi:hypothetical protein
VTPSILGNNLLPSPPYSASSSAAKTKYSNQVPRGVKVFTMSVVAEEGEDTSQAM